MHSYFIAVLNDQELIKRDTLDEITSIEFVDMYFKKELYREIINNFGSKEFYYTYTVIDKSGKKKIIDAGNFKITDISPDTMALVPKSDKSYYLIGRDVLVHDLTTKTNHKYRLNISSDNFIIKEFLPLIKNLQKANDWETFTSLSKIPMLEEKIEFLTKQIKKQKEEIILLKQRN